MELNLKAMDLKTSLNTDKNEDSRKIDEKSTKSGEFDKILSKKNEEKDEKKSESKNPITKYKDSKKSSNSDKINNTENKEIKNKIEEEIENLDEETLEEVKKCFEHLILMGNLDINNFQISDEKLKNMISQFVSSNEDIVSMLDDKNLSNVLKELIMQLNEVPEDEKININDILEKLKGNMSESKDSSNKAKPSIVELQNNYKTSYKETMNENNTSSNNGNNNSNEQNLNKNIQSTSKEEQLLEKLSGNKKDDNIINKFNLNKVFTNTEFSSKPVENNNIFINKMTFNEDIIKSIKYMNINNIQDLTVKINPKELGEIIINLTMEGDSMKAQLKSANKETFAMLNANVKEIVDKLSGESIKISQVEVAVYNEDTTYFSGEKHKNSNFNNENKKKDNNEKSLKEISEEISSEKLGTNDNLNMLV